MVVGAHLSFPEANILPRYDTWMNRINNRVDATNQSVESLQANQQANNAKLAISVGSVFGQGVGDGKLKEFLPEAYADFYYATFVEEFGSGYRYSFADTSQHQYVGLYGCISSYWSEHAFFSNGWFSASNGMYFYRCSTIFCQRIKGGW
jgi:hypothetical protein